MGRNENTTENPQTLPTPTISEYRIGNTTYIVETHFCGDDSETIKAIISRMIAREIKNGDYSA
ncbi:MAG: transposon-encoded TnpW family protein [Ruminococcus sp.]|uniref:transposon-encoded TnpW family protein n=1 Tax=Ruminococcus sp. TaxID=41978 RepID=UPI0025CBE6AA|nr:transposon-encoded TnpW family protein [Ruminococcus sp.]MBR5682407.1 transposon-encoded TnpW family protein [Ruminococcus sp.]